MKNEKFKIKNECVMGDDFFADFLKVICSLFILIQSRRNCCRKKSWCPKRTKYHNILDFKDSFSGKNI